MNEGFGQFARKKNNKSDPLEPSWGEPELLMNLSCANLHRNLAGPCRGAKLCRICIAACPYWHYVRAYFLQQIRDAKDKAR